MDKEGDDDHVGDTGQATPFPFLQELLLLLVVRWKEEGKEAKKKKEEEELLPRTTKEQKQTKKERKSALRLNTRARSVCLFVCMFDSVTPSFLLLSFLSLSLSLSLCLFVSLSLCLCLSLPSLSFFLLAFVVTRDGLPSFSL